MTDLEGSYFIHVTSRPKPKERPRMTKRGHAFTPKATHEAEKCIHDAWEASKNPTLEGPVSVTIVYSKESTSIWVAPFSSDTKNWGGDVDNLIKLTLDGLQGEGGAFLNDSQVRRVDAIKL
tara:strand:- start:12839 stop:13201 length:363 start_codon:yes stop_codon:yes gene_type:complete